MPKESIIKHFSSSTTGNVPSSGDLIEGELAINTADEKVFFKNLAGNVVSLGASKDISGAYAKSSSVVKSLLISGGSISLTGDVTLTAGTNITVTNPSPGVIRIANVYVAPDPPTVGNGTLTLTTSGTGLTGYEIFTANQSGNSTFTVTSNATSANTANAIVSRDGNGDFTGRYINASYFNHSHSAAYRGSDTQFYSSTDNYIRKNTKAGFLASLGLTNTASANTAGAIVVRDGIGNFSAGTITASLAGNASTATSAATLTTARSINGTSFNGGSDITTANWGTSRTITVGDTGKSVNGSGNVSWSFSEIGAVSTNTANKIVLRDGSGNFSAGTATLGALTVDTNTLHVDAANDRVGIGTTTPGYKLEVNGSFAATTKSFVIPHPTQEGMTLRHGSLEGPENGVYVRGRAHGHTITLPHYWTGLVDEETITVQLTPFGKPQNLWVESVSIGSIGVSGCDDPSYFYTVYGERKDVPKLKVEV